MFSVCLMICLQFSFIGFVRVLWVCYSQEEMCVCVCVTEDILNVMGVLFPGGDVCVCVCLCVTEEILNVMGVLLPGGDVCQHRASAVTERAHL